MTQTTQPLDRPAFGPQGEACATCGTLLARDQRYCLTCGARRAGLGAMLAAPPESVRERTTVRETAEAPRRDDPWRLDASLLAGIGCLLLALLVGVLIGRSAGGDDSRRASAPQVVTLGGATAPAAGTTAPASFTSDWPAGKRGFTLQLKTLPKDGSDAAAVAAAKQDATAKGAPDVGALDSDGYGTLDPGVYVIFSGQYADKKAASSALKDLPDGFDGAKVVEVAEKAAQAAKQPKAGKDEGAAATGMAKQASAAEQAAGQQAIEDIESSSGQDYSKKSAKLPKKLVTPGELPPEDKSKPAGGGSESVTFP
jgi:hypothetical protein